jgi:type II restriction enzyme
MLKISQGTAPTILMLERNEQWCVTRLSALHAAFLTPSVIEKRRPLAITAKRAGWTGCNIRLDRISPDAEIDIIESRRLILKADVRRKFSQFQTLVRIPAMERGWTNLVLKVLRESGLKQFTLNDIYSRKKHFSAVYPNNRHLEAKIRQQLQVLRDVGLVRFDGNGKYTLDHISC